MVLKQKIFLTLFLVILFLGALSRFYNITWGSPFFFHPDENNISYAISNLSFPSQMNPHFFAYGSFPLYVIYFTSFIINLFHQPPFQVIAYTSRSYSAIFSIGIMLSLFYVGKKIHNTAVGVLSSILAALGTGFIQYAHFGTFEMWLTFLSLWFFYFWYLFSKKYSLKILLLLGLLGGLLVGTKVSLSVVLPLPLLPLFFLFQKNQKGFNFFIRNFFIYTFSLFLVFFLTNPFVFFDFPSFLSSMHYESGVALGTIPVFYTQSFLHTIPVIFQLLYVYPFLLNPFILILFCIALVLSILFSKKYLKYENWYILIFLGILFFSEAFFFVKWTRYMVPTLPFMYLFLASFLEKLSKKIRLIVSFTLIVVSLFYSSAYVKTVFLSPDTRIQAANWLEKRTSFQDQTLTEPYDLGILPFNGITSPQNIKQIDFYSIDTIPSVQKLLTDTIKTSQIVILPSQRIVRSRRENPQLFPISSQFYTNLFSGKLGLKKIYQTPCDMYCKITYMGDPIFHVEETVNVFDRPTIFIFQQNP